MARIVGTFVILMMVISICEAAASFQPISDSHRSSALELFNPLDWSSYSLEETYEAVRVFGILGIEKISEISTLTCPDVTEKLGSSSSLTPKNLFFALRVNGALNCNVDDGVLEGITSRLLTDVKDASTLLDFYYSVGSLVLVKGQNSKNDLVVDDADGILRSIKALSQTDGRWRYRANNPESSNFATGLALETIAGVVSLASSEIDQSLIRTLKNNVVKLFDSIEKYDDGAYYFDEKLVDGHEPQGPLSTSSSVVRGLTAFATVTSGSYNIPGEKILGLAKFFLGIGTPGNAKDFFNQLDSLACLESNRVSIPLILSLQSTVLSMTKKNALQVRVHTVLGSNAPSLTVKLIKAYSTALKDVPAIESQELKYNEEIDVHYFDALPTSIDLGSYEFVFEIVLHDLKKKKAYTVGGQIKVPIYVTGTIKIDSAEIAILDTDLGSIETQQKLNLAGEDTVSLSANHLQKLRVSFQLTTPLGHTFKPHQVFLKLRHETNVEHIYLVGSSGRKFQISLDILGLVEKLYYLSGRYNIELTIGDAFMENSFSKALGHVELDLPEAPEKAPRPPAQHVDPYSIYAPKDEISHIFRSPEKRPHQELSLVFLGLTFLPLFGFVVMLISLGVNMKNFPTSAAPATFAILFHGGIAAVLLLYVLFWLKLDLFTTLKTAGFLGMFLIVVGHRVLSNLASTTSKLKST